MDGDDAGSTTSKESYRSRSSQKGRRINLLASPRSLGSAAGHSHSAVSPASKIDPPSTDSLQMALLDMDADDDDGIVVETVVSSNSYNSEDEVKMMHLQSILHGLRSAEALNPK
jgi:hypothetical protein